MERAVLAALEEVAAAEPPELHLAARLLRVAHPHRRQLPHRHRLQPLRQRRQRLPVPLRIKERFSIVSLSKSKALTHL